MTKFRTRIQHKPSGIEVFGHVIELKPDADGYCEFDVPEDRADVAERLREIPEGFLEVSGAPVAKKDAEPVKQPAATSEGEPASTALHDLDAMERPELAELAKSMGVAFPAKAGAAGIRAKIREAQAA